MHVLFFLVNLAIIPNPAEEVTTVLESVWSLWNGEKIKEGVKGRREGRGKGGGEGNAV